MITFKTKLIIIVALIFLISILSFTVLRNKKEINGPAQNALPTEALQDQSQPPTPDVRKYNVVKVEPADNSESISPDTDIKITFDTKPDPNLINFSIMPETKYKISYSGNSLLINPEKDLLPGNQYTYIIKYNNDSLPSKTYTFITVGKFKGALNTEPIGAAQAEAEFQRQNHPDVFLSNLTPYQSSSFDITSEFVGEEDGHFRFTVTSKSENAFVDFENYLISLGLTADQIAGLDTIFQ